MKFQLRLLLLLVLPFCAVMLTACKIYYSTPEASYNIPTSADVTEGKRMTMLVCAPCHYDASTKKLSGKRMADVPGFVGRIYASNITHHSNSALAGYSDAELAVLIRTGLSKEGKIMPYMQRPNMADEDLQNIIAFLRSEDELLSPVAASPGNTNYTPMGKAGISRTKPVEWTDRAIGRPAAEDKTALGRYLVDNLSCYDCHSKSFMGIDKVNPQNSKGFMGGGNKLKDISGNTIVSSNLTPHETGIGNWTIAEFERAMRDGVAKDNSIIRYPMPMFSELSDEEIEAIFVYLQKIPPIKNKIKKP